MNKKGLLNLMRLLICKAIVEPLELQQIIIQINQSELDELWAKMNKEHEQNQREIG